MGEGCVLGVTLVPLDTRVGRRSMGAARRHYRTVEATVGGRWYTSRSIFAPGVERGLRSRCRHAPHSQRSGSPRRRWGELLRTVGVGVPSTLRRACIWRRGIHRAEVTLGRDRRRGMHLRDVRVRRGDLLRRMRWSWFWRPPAWPAACRKSAHALLYIIKAVRTVQHAGLVLYCATLAETDCKNLRTCVFNTRELSGNNNSPILLGRVVHFVRGAEAGVPEHNFS
jgi:hypothetical protein